MAFCFCAIARREEKQICLERKENSRAVVIAIEWQNGRADLAASVQREINVVAGEIRGAIANG